MADPAVSGFITKLLCSSGGCSSLKELLPLLGLPEHQLVQILQDEQERFLVIQQSGGSCQVLAVSPVRLCRAQECLGCQHLHICKNYYIKGRCFMSTGGRARGACKYSHDILSEDNRKVLKKHGLSGLNENELRVLLLQNDPFLLPVVCNAYNKGRCNQQDNCTKLHICEYFLKGKCRFPQCKRSHCLMEPKALKQLLAEGVDDKTAFNIQTICDYRSAALVAELGKCKSSSPSSKPEVNQEKSNSGNQSRSTLEKSFDLIDFGDIEPNRDVTIAHGTRSPQTAEKEKIEEICLYYIFRFCKHKKNCSMMHYHLPYRWQINSGNGWNDLPKEEEIEKAYCDPRITSIWDLDINFKTMTCSTAPIRRLSTPSSVTKPAKFVLTTKWLWYWQNDMGQWIEYGKQDGKTQSSSLGSDDLENLFLANPDDSINFNAGSEIYVISFTEMTQRNMMYQTKREVRRRPKFVSSEDVKTKKGHTAAAAPVPTTSPAPATSPPPLAKYPVTWDKSALPVIGYKAIELSQESSEYIQIKTLFQKTMSSYVIKKIKRIQNPSLWEIFQWQKEQMTKKGGQYINERLLFHGTTSSSVEAICNDNFDWRICGTNGTVFGKGSYFARDAQYSHRYCQHTAKTKVMFVAQVLVGDFTVGHASYSRPPAKSTNKLHFYDSCVDNMTDPSIFVIFEKHQIYPAYTIDYSEEEKCILS